MATFRIETIEPQSAAVVRAEVPVEQITTVFDHAFGAVMAVAATQGLTITDAPFGYYPRMPTDTVEVAAGFPVSAPVAPDGEVVPMDLPGGPAVIGVHVGPYDTLEVTYRELMAWAAAEGISLAGPMWESYLTDPTAEPDPAKWETRITWPVA